MSAQSNTQSAFAIQHVSHEGGEVVQHQQLSAAVADHRGLIELPALAVLVDTVGGIPFWRSFGAEVATVQARLSMSAEGRAGVNDEVVAAARLVHRDDVYGSTVVHLATAGGPVCSALARSMRVGRGVAPGASARWRESAAVPATAEQALPPAIDPELDGKRVVAGIADGTLSPGPLVEMLNASVGFTEEGVHLRAQPHAWMANVLGSVHGGVIAALLGQACSLAGQVHTGPGQGYMLADVTVNFFRSPRVDEPLVVTTEPEKIGRRIGSVSAAMTGADGTPFARAVADVHYF